MIPRHVFAQPGRPAQLSPPARRPPRRFLHGKDEAYYPDERGPQFDKKSDAHPLYSNKYAPRTSVYDKSSNPLFDRAVTARPVLSASEAALLKQLADRDVQRGKTVIPSDPQWWLPRYQVFVPTSWAGGTADVTLYFAAAKEMMRHGMRSFFEGKSNSVLVQVPGVEDGSPLAKAWGVGITDAILNALLGARGISGWRVRAIACYSTGYRGFNESIEQLAAKPKQSVPAGRLTIDKNLKTAVLYDCLYKGTDVNNPDTTRTETAMRSLRRLAPNAKLVVYGATQSGTALVNGDTLVPQATLKSIFGADYAFVDLAKQPEHAALLTIAYARTFQAAIADGYYTLSQFDSGIQTLIQSVPKRGDLTSAVPAGFRSFPGKTSLVAYAAGNKVGMDTVLRKQETQLIPKIKQDYLVGYNPGPDGMAHDGIIREFGHEFLLG